jgi:hypothetical protein
MNSRRVWPPVPMQAVYGLTAAAHCAMDAQMNYEGFKSAWDFALQSSGLPTIGPAAETIDIRAMSRHYCLHLEPPGRHDNEPFHISATLEFEWGALQTARTYVPEEDVLTAMLGRESAHEIETEQPWLRVDVKLTASLPWGKAIPMPAAKVWREWAREVTARLERIEPLVPEETVREGKDGALEVLAWKGDPELHVICNDEGALSFESVEIHGWQSIVLPRHWDDSEREDKGPEEQLGQMFTRLRKAIGARMESVDHLRPVGIASPKRD